ncbi:MAG: Crp/Fnr family transcriptional regulator, partial [Bryobacteraceae bacterium]
METLERIVAEHPFFAGLEEQYLQLLAGCASNVRFEGGKYILREGEEASQFFLIRHGKVALEISAPH